MLKKIVLLVMTLLFVFTSTALACSFHNMLPQTDSEEYLDTLYVEYEIEVPEDLEGVVAGDINNMVRTYIYVIETKEYIWIENAMGMIPGLYVLQNEEIEEIQQDEIDLDIINIVLKNGETIVVDTMSQADNEYNAFYIEEVDGTLYLDVKKEYMYLYEIENENNYVEEENKYDFVDEAEIYVNKRDGLAEELGFIEREDKTEIMNEARHFFETFFFRALLAFGILFLGVLYGIVVNGKNID